MKHTFTLAINEKGYPEVMVETISDPPVIHNVTSAKPAPITLGDIAASYAKLDEREYTIVGFREPEVGEKFLAARDMRVVTKQNNRTSGKRLIVVEN